MTSNEAMNQRPKPDMVAPPCAHRRMNLARIGVRRSKTTQIEVDFLPQKALRSSVIAKMAGMLEIRRINFAAGMDGSMNVVGTASGLGDPAAPVIFPELTVASRPATGTTSGPLHSGSGYKDLAVHESPAS